MTHDCAILAAFFIYTGIMKYPEEAIKLDLMHYMGYNEQQAERLVEFYKRNNELDDLAAAIETKKEACSRP